MKKLLLALSLLVLLAAGCAKVALQHEVPTSPKAAQEELPK